MIVVQRKSFFYFHESIESSAKTILFILNELMISKTQYMRIFYHQMSHIPQNEKELKTKYNLDGDKLKFKQYFTYESIDKFFISYIVKGEEKKNLLLIRDETK